MLSCISNIDPIEQTLSTPHLKEYFELDGGEACDVGYPILSNNKIIVPITNQESREAFINCYDKNSLELLWTWEEAMIEFGIPAKGFSLFGHVYNGILAVSERNLSYGINVETGETIWKNRDLDTRSAICLWS